MLLIQSLWADIMSFFLPYLSSTVAKSSSDTVSYTHLDVYKRQVLAAYLQELAREEVLTRFGNKIFIRGLIEITLSLIHISV